MATPPEKFRRAIGFACNGPAHTPKNPVCTPLSLRLMRSNKPHTRKLNSTKMTLYDHRHYHLHESMIRIQQISIPSRILSTLLLILATGIGPATVWLLADPILSWRLRMTGASTPVPMANWLPGVSMIMSQHRTLTQLRETESCSRGRLSALHPARHVEVPCSQVNTSGNAIAHLSSKVPFGTCRFQRTLYCWKNLDTALDIPTKYGAREPLQTLPMVENRVPTIVMDPNSINFRRPP